ncbi:hypothetical protein [Desulfoplanes sp.]
MSHHDQKIDTPSLTRICSLLGIDPANVDAHTERLPFVFEDVTAGSENELQVAVIGTRDDVDLPLSIKQSSYYRNIRRRTARGDTSRKIITDLEEYLRDNPGNVWENSWVRFPRRHLSREADTILENDLVRDKSDPESPRRLDYARFVFEQGGEPWIRIPVSYLLKLALADLITFRTLPAGLHEAATRFLNHFLSDNTSPETFSLYVTPLSKPFGNARAISRETGQRFLLCQCLVAYANKKFHLEALGQRVVVYAAPHPPIRQKRLNTCISDSFYRQIFMSPCLSGWNKGEDKHAYMGLCHRVLSRSQMNTLPKLREAGIITRNLVVLPNASNISLANNGTHISLGSSRLTSLMKEGSRGLTFADEKYVGDLVIKIVEHMLPLFVGTYSAAPYRMDFKDFHPETVLGFLPHELDFTHLRMIWRRWKKKASLRFFGQRITPFGPELLDNVISIIFRLQGDHVPDFRLIDYLACLMSTHTCPGLDGNFDNDIRLKKDLAELGIFHPALSTYLLYKIRHHNQMGFSGFEGRYYSLFPSLNKDMTEATALQTLITALAYKLVVSGKITHAHIPDTPSTESERRQIFFGSAIGIPTFYVRKKTKNRFLLDLIRTTKGLRTSRRYKGYFRVYNAAYRRSVLEMISTQGQDLVELMGLEHSLKDLQTRIDPRTTTSAAARLTDAVLDRAGAKTPLRVKAETFNAAAEAYYREDLRITYVREGFHDLHDDLKKAPLPPSLIQATQNNHLHNASAFMLDMESKLCMDSITLDELISTTMVLVHVIADHAKRTNRYRKGYDAGINPPIYLPTYRAGKDRKAL